MMGDRNDGNSRMDAPAAQWALAADAAPPPDAVRVEDVAARQMTALGSRRHTLEADGAVLPLLLPFGALGCHDG